MKHSQVKQIRSQMEIYAFVRVAADFQNKTASFLEDSLISECLRRLHLLRPQLQKAIERLHRAETDLAQKKESRKIARTKLKTTVRDFWDMLKRMFKRLEYDRGDIQLYRRIHEYGPLKIKNTDECLSIAEAFINGDKLAQEKGLRAMDSPSAAELQEAVNRVRDADYAALDIRVGNLRQELEEPLDEAKSLHAILNKSMKMVHKKLEPSQLRALMRIVGFKFKKLSPKEETETEAIMLETLEAEGLTHPMLIEAEEIEGLDSP